MNILNENSKEATALWIKQWAKVKRQLAAEITNRAVKNYF